MAAAILIAQGMPADEAMRLIKAKRREADPEAAYIKRRIMLFAERWMGRDSGRDWKADGRRQATPDS